MLSALSVNALTIVKVTNSLVCLKCLRDNKVSSLNACYMLITPPLNKKSI